MPLLLLLSTTTAPGEGSGNIVEREGECLISNFAKVAVFLVNINQSLLHYC